MLATQVVLCATVAGNAALLLIVLREHPSPVRLIFSLYIGCIAAWAFTIYLNLFLRSFIVEQLIFASAAGMLTSQFWFARIFPTGQRPAKLWSYWSLAVGLFFVLASFYPGALFSSILIHSQGYTTLDSGPLSGAYSLFALAYVCAPAIIFFRKHRAEARGPLRRQLRYITIGFTASLITELLTNSVLPVFFHIYNFNAIGPAFSLIFASVIFYIISKYEFLDIRRVILRGATYSLIIGIVLLADIVLLALVERYLESIRLFTWIHADDVVDPMTAVIVTAAGIATAPLLERYFQRRTDWLFFKDRYNYAIALESLSAVLAESVDFDELIRRIQEHLAKILRAEFVDVSLYGADSGPDTRQTDPHSIASRETLFQPIVVDQREIGSILVGHKSSGDKYRREDERLLRTFALQAATALARAKLFMQVRKHAGELEQKVVERTEELRQAQERERQVMLDLAHSLQTPLAVLGTGLERLKSHRGVADTAALKRAFENLSIFVSDLLKLANLEHADALAFDRLDLSRFTDELCDEAAIIAQTRRITIHRAIEPGIFVQADARELRVAAMNVIGNAIKYMREDAPRDIEVHLVAQNGSALLSIRDTGIGIPPEDLSHIFDRFYRAGHSEETGGGLGLPIARAIIERHGGSIEAASAPGEGTVMTIRLPASRAVL